VQDTAAEQIKSTHNLLTPAQ